MTEIAAHRGGAALWPENSAVAFRGAAGLGVEQVEFDVRLSADGEPVIFHDATLDRMTDGAGPVSALTLAQLKGLAIKSGGGKILTLEEGLDLLQPTDLILRCEIKPEPDGPPCGELREQTLATLARRGLLARTVITSFHLPTVEEARRKVQALRDVIWLVADPILHLTSPEACARLAREAGVDHVAPRCAMLRGEALARLRAAGLRVGAFAVHDDTAIAWALQNALTVFTTDRPDAAVAMRRAADGAGD